jgi:hypothetical protein
VIKFILKPIFYSILFYFVLLCFLPKESIYNYVLNELTKEKVYINQKEFTNHCTGLDIDSLKINYNSIDAVTIKSINFQSYLFYNQLNLSNITIDPSLKKFAPDTIKNMDITYSVLNPLAIQIKGGAKLFNFTGDINLIDRIILINISASKQFKRLYPTIMRQLKKVKSKDKKQEYYIYEYKY